MASRTRICQPSASPSARDKNVVVPNPSGFAGVSWRYPNAKVSVGYRADMFFGAIDGGIDIAHRENRAFTDRSHRQNRRWIPHGLFGSLDLERAALLLLVF
jgi:hypothetical protein